MQVLGGQILRWSGSMDNCQMCNYFLEQEIDGEKTGNTFCSHPDNESNNEGNANEKDCPLIDAFTLDKKSLTELQYLQQLVTEAIARKQIKERA